MQCCTATKHAWESYKVATTWFPSELRCLIVGDNPGDVNSPYFYDSNSLRSDAPDPVRIRQNLLRGLYRVNLIQDPTLQAFCAAGFLFDHAIRCHLPQSTVAKERQVARRFASFRAHSATHLEPLIKQAPKVWVMGYIARNAVVACNCGLPENWRPIARPPYPIQVPKENPRFFVSRYLTNISNADIEYICGQFQQFL